MRTKLLRLFALITVLLSTLFLTGPTPSVDAQSPDNSVAGAAAAAPVGSAFSYQGRLTTNGNPSNGAFDFQFILYDALTGGNQQGATVTKAGITVNNGLFTTQLDFGQGVFNGDQRFVEVAVKNAGGTGYTTLSPRTALAAVPYALGIPGVTFKNGNLGFNTVNPEASIHIVGGFIALRDGSGNRGSNYYVTGAGSVLDSPTANLFIRTQNHTLLLNAGPEDGNVVIGAGGPPASKLHVHGDIRVSNGNFIDDGTQLNVPDYVFEDEYPLLTLDELAAFIEREKHLPGVPSEEEIHRDGLNLSEFHMRLLEKVEELTLYTLAQQEQLDAQQAQIAALEARLAALEAK